MRNLLIGLATAAVVALPACGSEAPSAADLCPTPTDATTLEMADFSYAPECATVDAGASLQLRNVGQSPHTFTVNDTEIDENVDPGGSATIDLAGIPAGTYEVICTLHPQMKGALQIR